MTISVNFTVEQYEKNAATILSILKGETVAVQADAPAKSVKAAAEEPAEKAPAKKAPAKKAAAAKAEPKVSVQQATDALMKVKEDKDLGIAECRRIMSVAGVPGEPPKIAAMTEEHAEKVYELCILLLEGGEEAQEEGEEEDL